METTEQIVIKDFKPIPLESIEISESNVRKTRQKAGLEELKASIEKIGLIHPIIVVEPEPGKFKLIMIYQAAFLSVPYLHAHLSYPFSSSSR